MNTWFLEILIFLAAVISSGIMDNTPHHKIQKVNIRQVFASKNPGLARLIPGFVYRYLEKIVHQDFVNDFMERHGDKQNLDFIDAAIDEFNTTLTVKGEEYIPRKGRYIFVSNHPLGGFDGILLMKVISKYHDNFRFLVNDILMNIVNLQGLFIPINKHGKQAVQTAHKVASTYASDTQVLTFPAGYVSRKIKGQIVDLPWQKSFVSKAVQYQRGVIPVHFSGKNTNFFYRLGQVRKFLGIKANLEMFYLVDETYKHRNKNITITFGPPIAWQTFDKSKKPNEWAFWVKEKVYRLGGVTSIPL